MKKHFTQKNMNKFIKIAAIAALCVVAGCKNTPKQSTDKTDSVTALLNKTGNRQKAVDGEGISLPESLLTEEELGGYPIKDRQVEIKEFYVTARQGIDAKQEPDENSGTLLHYSYGDGLNVFTDPGKQYDALYYDSMLYRRASSGVMPEFYAVGGNVYREWCDDERGSTVQCWRYELVFVKRSAVGELSEVRLIPEELNEKIEIGEGDERTSEVRLTVELTDKSVYDSMTVRKPDDILADTANFTKTDGRIVLKTETGEVVFEDRTDASDYYKYYYHKGTYEELNQYVVSVQYYDYFGYQMVNKTTGEIMDFAGFPHVSPNQKYIFCIYPVIDADGLRYAGIELYKITDDKKIVKIMELQYMNWGVTDHERDTFWGADGCFYCKARHPKVNWGNNLNCEYLRIRLPEMHSGF